MGYCLVGIVGVNLTVGRPLKNGKKRFCVQVIEPGGKTVKMLIFGIVRGHIRCIHTP